MGGVLDLRLYAPLFSYASPTNEIEGLAKEEGIFQVQGKRRCLESGWKLLTRKENDNMTALAYLRQL